MTTQTIHPELKKLNVSIIDAGACFYWVRIAKTGTIISGRNCSSWKAAHNDALENHIMSYDFNTLIEVFNDAVRPKTRIVVTYSIPFTTMFAIPSGAKLEKVEYK